MTNTFDDHIAQYRGHAQEHGRATATGDNKAANRHHDALLGVLAEIRKHGDVGGAALSTLLTDDDPSVRCWAFGLEFKPRYCCPWRSSSVRAACRRCEKWRSTWRAR